MKKEKLNPKTVDLEFFGPKGCLFLMVSVGLVPILLNSTCHKDGCPSLSFVEIHDLSKAIYFYLHWLMLQIALYYLVPGQWTAGTKLRNGRNLEYKINAFRVLLVTHMLGIIAIYCQGLDWLLWIANHSLEICLVAFGISTIQALFLYLYSYRNDQVLLSLVGNSGHFLHDFWMGRELNPRIGSFDLKYFCELRPGMFLWCLLNYSYLTKQLHDHGIVTNSMMFVCFTQMIYIADSVWFEASILTTMDITTDGFGYMLSVGDLLWVPFTFTMQARYLCFYPVELDTWQLAATSSLFLMGYSLFRGSNSQKNRFRTDPAYAAKTSYIQTKRGTKLLTSGFWGISRHINYLGDWLLGISWCLCTGVSSIIPWFYMLYFVPLLLHRSLRDDHKCRLKYGQDWKKYCELVPWKIIPFVY